MTGDGHELTRDEVASALHAHEAGVAETTHAVAESAAAGDLDPDELAAARTEAEELLAFLRDLE